MLPPYDSPTHLGHKDKYLFCFSLPELIVCFGVVVGCFLFSLGFPYNLIGRALIALPLSAVIIFFIFFRKWGLPIPLCIYYTVTRLFKKPAYEDVPKHMLLGQPEWLANKDLIAAGGGGGIKKFLPQGKRSQKMQQQLTDNRGQMEAEAERRMEDSARAAEGIFRDLFRIIFKGGK